MSANGQKKNIYFIQVGVTYSELNLYLPYAAGCIASYAFADAGIAAVYDIGEIIAVRERPEIVLDRLDQPYLAAFSCYTWDIEYNKALAGLIKERFPACIIVFGGHEIPSDTSYLDSFPYIDILISGEGERPFAALLLALSSGKGPDGIPGVAFRQDGRAVITPAGEPDTDLSAYPSPYLTGMFDDLMTSHPEITYVATLETNRGCPYGCAYCDWSSTKKIRRFDMDKIRAEIDWMSGKKIEYVCCADANFGILRRDIDIARYVVEKHKQTGYPRIFKPCYAKNSDDIVFEAGKLLNDAGADKGVTLAYQSLSPQALKNIGRENLTLEHFASLDARYAAAGIPTYTELILGMPGETYDSFAGGMCYLLEKGQHNSMTVYNCQVYVNSPMGDPAYQKEYGIETSRIPLHGIHYPADFNGVQEYYNVITGTASMPKEMWVKANMFSIVLQSFHHLGLLRCFAIWLRTEMGISYLDFYSRLMDFIFSDKTTGNYALFNDMRERTADTKNGDWTFKRDEFSPVGWYFEEGAFLDMACRGDEFWSEIEPFVRSFGIPDDIFDALFAYQKAIIRRPGMKDVTISSPYDFYSYFNNIYDGRPQPLLRRGTVLTIALDKQIRDWAQYAVEIIWFGKRRSATLVTNPREKTDVRYVS